MGLTKYKIGSLVELYIESCNNPNLTIYDVSGINRDKEFFEPSKQVGVDTSSYKIVPLDHFACNLMHVGRDKVLPIALNHSEKNKIVSPAYTVFKIIEGMPLLKEYFFMLLKSNERDRYFWFHTDSSVRDGMSWDDMCNIDIELPPVPTQQKYVDVYKAMLQNQHSYENGLEDLKLTCEIEIDKIKHKASRIQAGNLLDIVDVRNSDGSITSVQGINITKNFMPSVASLAEGNIKNYKIVRNGQFAYSSMQTGRDECIRIALYKGDNPIIVSPAYSVLQVKEKKILAEYIMLWFSRSESDRYGWFASDGSIRSNLDLERFFEINIPLPTIEHQRSIVGIYNAYIMRREINEKLKVQLKDLCPILIKGSMEEAAV